jgi:hypothetical protein
MYRAQVTPEIPLPMITIFSFKSDSFLIYAFYDDMVFNS